MRPPLRLWLEPIGPPVDLDAGLRARVADPAWFLARQWQLGEHQGEDASSPVSVTVEVSHLPLGYDPGRPALDPTVIPAEALLEAEPGDWWTVGRRVRLGRVAEPLLGALTDEARDALRFAALPGPYDVVVGEIDGRAVFDAGLLPGEPLWAEVPDPAPDRWSATELTHEAAFDAGGVPLAARQHDGGDVDWFTVDGPGGEPPLVCYRASWQLPGPDSHRRATTNFS